MENYGKLIRKLPPQLPLDRFMDFVEPTAAIETVHDTRRPQSQSHAL